MQFLIIIRVNAIKFKKSKRCLAFNLNHMHCSILNKIHLLLVSVIYPVKTHLFFKALWVQILSSRHPALPNFPPKRTQFLQTRTNLTQPHPTPANLSHLIATSPIPILPTSPNLTQPNPTYLNKNQHHPTSPYLTQHQKT